MDKKVGIFTILLAILTLVGTFTVPEVRTFVGLEVDSGKQSRKQESDVIKRDSAIPQKANAFGESLPVAVAPKVEQSLDKIDTSEKLQAAIVGKWQPSAGNTQDKDVEFTNEGKLIIEGTIFSIDYRILDASHIRLKYLSKSCGYNVSLENGVLRLSSDYVIASINMRGDYVRIKPIPPAPIISTPIPEATKPMQGVSKNNSTNNVVIPAPIPRSIEQAPDVGKNSSLINEVDLRMAILGRWSAHVECTEPKISADDGIWNFDGEGRTYKVIDGTHIEMNVGVFTDVMVLFKVTISGDTMTVMKEGGKCKYVFTRVKPG